MRHRLHSVPLVMIALLFLTFFYAVTITITLRQSHSMLGIEGFSLELRQLSPGGANGTSSNSSNETAEVEWSQFPMDIFTLEQKRMGAILLHILGIIYMLIGLALVCDEFFVPSLEVIVEKLKIPNDVAGATFMAAGGSAPEFFTSLFGIFFARNSIGFGTIVGSAVFNILFVIGLCGVLAKHALYLTWWPLFRDTSFYAVALAVLIGFFQGGQIEWYESLVLFMLYILYVLFMFINGRAEKLARKLVSKLRQFCSCKKKFSHAPSEESTVQAFGDSSQVAELGTESDHIQRELSPLPFEDGKESQLDLGLSKNHKLAVSSAVSRFQRRISSDSGFHSPSDVGSPAEQTLSVVPSVFFSQTIIPEPLPPINNRKQSSSSISSNRNDSHKGRTLSRTSTSLSVTNQVPGIPVIQVEPVEAEGEPGRAEEEEQDIEEEGIVHIKPPKGWCKRIQYVLFFPLIVLLFFTLPNVRKPRWRCFFPYVFVGSIVWIGVFSYFMVWWATEFGETAMIPPSVMGMTILAAGTSIPDLISSVIVARKGFGDMAVSSSIGSNMFDITVGLPVPWLLYSAINSGESIEVFSMGLFCSVILLVGMLLVAVLSIAIFRWKLGKLLGVFFLLMYIVFVTLGILLELVIVCTIS